MTLFGLFTVVALFLVGIGSRVYAASQDGFETEYLLRTTLSYVSGKTRYESAAQLDVRDAGDGDALVFVEQAGDAAFETWIYFSDGVLSEQYLRAGDDFSPSGGTALFALDGFSFSLDADGKTLVLHAEKGGEAREITLCVNRFAEVSA